MRDKKEVLVIFKTHLDIGFTDFSENVLRQYFKKYIPDAIKVGYELKAMGTPFIWTVGSWLVWQALKHDKSGIVENAIKDGILSWHALPFTTHTELMSEKLFEYGVKLSKKLDERFCKKTIGSKMTDVPGHTKGMIPIMQRNGIKFLHIGVNTATPVPKLPPVFKWRYAGSEIIVMYQGDYGEIAEFDDFVVYFAHTNDNCGPQSAQEILDVYKKIKKMYPGCDVKAATIDDLARKVCQLKDLPIVENEIGDTWIHGAGTDPQKVSRYRKLLRRFDEIDEDSVDLTDSLLCIPEHTWGMDFKTHFGDDKKYTHQEIESLTIEKEKIEKSWQEQRDYVIKAEKLMGVTPDYPIKPPLLNEYIEIEVPTDIDYEISWQLFDNSDYRRYENMYLRNLDVDGWWKYWDFTKKGLPQYDGGIYIAKIVKAYQRSDEKLYEMRFDEDIEKTYGLPKFYLSLNGENICATWFGKHASRFPQAFWFKIKSIEENWQIQKMGAWILVNDILDSPFICGIDKGVRNSFVTIECLDSILVAPFGRMLLQYGVEKGKQDLYFNLYNNIWNTNFPMWYSDDAMFRFKITKANKRK